MVAAHSDRVNAQGATAPGDGMTKGNRAEAGSGARTVDIEPWLATSVGQELLATERALLIDELATLFGYHVLQLGSFTAPGLLETSRIPHRVVLAPESYAQSSGASAVACAPDALPIAADSVDVVLLPHVLEFAADPHQILRECERVLIGEGHLIVLGFNPLSFWGLWRLARYWRGRPPWTGRFITPLRLRDWMQLLGFEVLRVQHYCFRPPFSHPGLARRLRVMERLGQTCWPAFGGAYLVVGRKRLVHLMRLKAPWRTRRVLAPGLVEPSIRSRGM